MSPSLGRMAEVPVMAELMLIAAAIGVQFLLGNHRRTCKQVRDQRKAKSLADAPASPSSPHMQLGYSKKDFF